jgi:micrococcal nuclease
MEAGDGRSAHTATAWSKEKAMIRMAILLLLLAGALSQAYPSPVHAQADAEGYCGLDEYPAACRQFTLVDDVAFGQPVFFQFIVYLLPSETHSRIGVEVTAEALIENTDFGLAKTSAPRFGEEQIALIGNMALAEGDVTVGIVTFREDDVLAVWAVGGPGTDPIADLATIRNRLGAPPADANTADRALHLLPNQEDMPPGFRMEDEIIPPQISEEAMLGERSQDRGTQEQTRVENTNGDTSERRPASALPRDLTCQDVDAWEWAQSVHEVASDANPSLDADGDGIACPELPRGGAAPVLWTDEVPEDVEAAIVVGVTDGDTIDIQLLNEHGEPVGDIETVRFILLDTPETRHPSTPVECYGAEATAYTTWLLSLADTVYLERDVSDTDRYGRLLRYVWLELDGELYLANEALARSGFAALSTYPRDIRYVDEIRDAQAFAREHELGLWGVCGGPDVPLTEADSGVGNTTAPTQGNTDVPPAQDIRPAQPPTPVAPPSGGGCDPSYPALCIPPYPPDLNCPDVGSSDFTVYQPDPHGFDGDYDGIGCESGASTGSGNVSAPPPSTGGGGSNAPVYTDFGGLDGVDFDCYDFGDNQAAAQAYFESDGGSIYNNADGLDRNHNGLACEPGEFD